MRNFLAFLVVSIFILLPFVNKADSETMGVEDLLNPEAPYTNEKTEGNKPLAQKPPLERNSDEILGPKDIFPFLPDNHRDSGTGKFNSF